MEKQEFVGQVISELLPVVQLVFIALIGWLMKAIGQFIAAKVKNEKVEGAMTRINATVWDVVMELEQTLVADIRWATDPNGDGGSAITADEAARIKSEALIRSKALLGKEGIAHLKDAFGLDKQDDAALDAHLSTKIESSVAQLKLEKGKLR
jgi:hypothetical protein